MKKTKEDAGKIKLIVWELIFIFSTVFIFRSTWTLLDKLVFMNSLSGLWSTLLLGITIAFASIHMVYKCKKLA